MMNPLRNAVSDQNWLKITDREISSGVIELVKCEFQFMKQENQDMLNNMNMTLTFG